MQKLLKKIVSLVVIFCFVFSQVDLAFAFKANALVPHLRTNNQTDVLDIINNLNKIVKDDLGNDVTPKINWDVVIWTASGDDRTKILEAGWGKNSSRRNIFYRAVSKEQIKGMELSQLRETFNSEMIFVAEDQKLRPGNGLGTLLAVKEAKEQLRRRYENKGIFALLFANNEDSFDRFLAFFKLDRSDPRDLEKIEKLKSILSGRSGKSNAKVEAEAFEYLWNNVIRVLGIHTAGEATRARPLNQSMDGLSDKSRSPAPGGFMGRSLTWQDMVYLTSLACIQPQTEQNSACDWKNLRGRTYWPAIDDLTVPAQFKFDERSHMSVLTVRMPLEEKHVSKGIFLLGNDSHAIRKAQEKAKDIDELYRAGFQGTVDIGIYNTLTKNGTWDDLYKIYAGYLSVREQKNKGVDLMGDIYTSAVAGQRKNWKNTLDHSANDAEMLFKLGRRITQSSAEGGLGLKVDAIRLGDADPQRHPLGAKWIPMGTVDEILDSYPKLLEDDALLKLPFIAPYVRDTYDEKGEVNGKALVINSKVDGVKLYPGAVVINSDIKNGLIGPRSVVVGAVIDTIFSEEDSCVWGVCKRSAHVGRLRLLCALYYNPDPERPGSKGRFIELQIPNWKTTDVKAIMESQLVSHEVTLKRVTEAIASKMDDVKRAYKEYILRAHQAREGYLTYDLFGYDVEMPQTHNGQDVSDILKASFNRTKEQINHRYATQAPLLIRRWNGPGQTGIDPEEQAIDRLNSGVEGYFRQAMAHSVVSTSISDFSDESTVRPVARQIHLLFDTLEAERNNLFQSPQLSDNKRERYKQLKNNKTYCLTEAAALYILNANWPKILMPRLKWDGEKNLNPASILEKGFNARRLLALAFLVEPDSWKQEVYTFIAGDVSIDRSSFEETSVQIVVVDFKKFPEIFRTLGGGPVFPEWYSGTIIVSNFPTNEKERAKSAAKTLSDKLLWLRYFLKICEAMTEQIVHGQYWTMLAGMANDRKFLNAFNNSIDGFHRLASSGLNARQALEAQITDEMLVRLHGIAFILRSKGEDNFAVVLDDIAYAYQLYQIDEARLVTLNPYTWASAAYKGAVSPPCAREGHTERNLFTAEFLRNAIETYWGITDSSLKDDIIKTAILFQMREGTLTENIIDTIFRNQRIIIDLPEKVFNYTQAYKDRFGTELGSTQDFLQEFGNGQQSNEERIMILNGLAGMLKSGSDSVRSSVRWVLGEILFNSLKLERYEDVLQNNIEARLVAPEGPSQIYMAYNNLDNQLSKDLLGEYFESIVNEDALYQERSIHKNYDGAVWLFNMIRLSKLIEEDRIDAAKFLYLKSLAGDRSLIINIFGCLSSEQYGHTSAFRVKARALLMYTVTLESYGALPYPGSRVRIMQDVDFTN